MKVTLEYAEYNDFRGVHKERIEFNPIEHTIELPNKTGKTTRATGISWVLLGKDFEGNSRFEVESNNTKNKPKTCVTLGFDIDGQKVEMSKTPGKWIYDKFEVKKNVFEDFVSNIQTLEVIEILMNPFAFMRLHWETRRNFLTKLFCEKVAEDSEFSFLMKSMSISDIRKSKTQQKKLANDGLNRSRIVIETHEKGIKETFDIDFLKLKKELSAKKKELEKLSDFDWKKLYEKESKVKTSEHEYNLLVNQWKEKNAEVERVEASTYATSKGCIKCGTKVPEERYNQLKKDHLILIKTQRENLQNEIIEKRKTNALIKKDFEDFGKDKPDETAPAIAKELQEGIDFLNIQIAKEDNIKLLNDKIVAEQEILDGFTDEIMEIEKFMDRFSTFLTENYYKSINDNFDGLFFDIEDECKLTNSQGTEYKYFSLSEKINAGVQIISVLSKKLNIKFPLFIDNRESVTDLYPIDTQVINLKVSQ